MYVPMQTTETRSCTAYLFHDEMLKEDLYMSYTNTNQ